MVRAAGIEPALLSERDFESRASTSSTTPAIRRVQGQCPDWSQPSIVISSGMKHSTRLKSSPARGGGPRSGGGVSQAVIPPSPSFDYAIASPSLHIPLPSRERGKSGAVEHISAVSPAALFACTFNDAGLGIRHGAIGVNQQGQRDWHCTDQRQDTSAQVADQPPINHRPEQV